jgi:FkbM family methyltransferase
MRRLVAVVVFATSTRLASARPCTPLLDDAALLHSRGTETACSPSVGLTTVNNPAYRICVRTAGNLVDDAVRASSGVWPDCALIESMLKGFHGLTVPVNEPTSTILDVGANIGACSVALAAQGHTVVAFEPKAEHVGMIKASVDANPAWPGKLYLHAVGLSDVATESATLATEDGNSGNSWVFVEKNGVHAADASAIGGRPDKPVSVDANIKLTTFDAYCHHTFDAVKMDAQGFEAAILRGGHKALRRGTVKRIMLEFWPFGLEGHGYSPSSLLQLLVNHNYRLFDESGTEIVPATFYAFDTRLRNGDAGNPGRGFGHLFAFHESVMRA